MFHYNEPLKMSILFLLINMSYFHEYLICYSNSDTFVIVSDLIHAKYIEFIGNV